MIPNKRSKKKEERTKNKEQRTKNKYNYALNIPLIMQNHLNFFLINSNWQERAKSTKEAIERRDPCAIYFQR